jgi:hypothetical protein
MVESIHTATGCTRTVLDDAYAAEFSADGQLAVYIKDWTYNAVYDFTTGVETVFDFNGDDPPYFCGGHAVVSPDNIHFVTWFEYGRHTALSNRYKLYNVSMRTGESNIIETGDSNCVYPRYSPDGVKLLFSQSGPDDVYRLVIYDLTTGNRSYIESSNSYETKCGCWSPDCTKICYIRNGCDSSSLCIFDIERGASEILRTSYDNGTTSVKRTVPSGFALENNYPNPFNPATTICFTLERAGYIRLEILSITGQNIRELISGHMTGGTHEIIWDGRDDRGVSVSSGAYMYRLIMGEQVTAKRMMLTR